MKYLEKYTCVKERKNIKYTRSNEKTSSSIFVRLSLLCLSLAVLALLKFVILPFIFQSTSAYESIVIVLGGSEC